MNRAGGFTLIEMLLSVSIIAMLAGLSLPVYMSFQNRNELDITAQSLASALRRAQVYARGMKDDDQWSVRSQTSGITLFKGTVYATRDTTDDEVISVPATITVSGTTDVLFAKLSGMPTAAGSITLTSSNNETRTITINGQGMVSY